ncbi:MAG: histidine triad nucleotide-binding protein [Coriobacteriia bacterium]|nr:histidine triad nucleotide-binding protein [Coriobacteriia bacterium]
MEDCIFCKIVRGEIPASIVYEDDSVLAFDDLSPQAPVHTLIIPKRHYASLSDDISAEDLAGVFGAVQHVARLKGVGASGYRIIVNSGQDANQTVGHLHVHVLGGRPMAHGMVVFAAE